MTDQEAVNRENDWWSNPRLEPILIGIYEDDMGDGYAKRLAARTALVELERERAALVAERDALREVQERVRLKMIEATSRTTDERNTYADGYMNGLASALDEFRIADRAVWA